jgi:predicted RNA-binding Zn ribbon-like protein
VNLASFADLAVRLVNSGASDADADPLRSCGAFREFVAGRPFLAVPVTPHDLEQLRLFRQELASVFSSAARGADGQAINTLNALMTVHPVHPVLVEHDGEPWHVHLSESGSMTDRYAAAAVISIALLLSQLGADRLGICAMASCNRAFIDSSSNKSRRYCSEHSATKANVTSLQRQNLHADLGQDSPVKSAAS